MRLCFRYDELNPEIQWGILATLYLKSAHMSRGKKLQGNFRWIPWSLEFQHYSGGVTPPGVLVHHLSISPLIQLTAPQL